MRLLIRTLFSLILTPLTTWGATGSGSEKPSKDLGIRLPGLELKLAMPKSIKPSIGLGIAAQFHF